MAAWLATSLHPEVGKIDKEPESRALSKNGADSPAV
jgi:hypothetical protein